MCLLVALAGVHPEFPLVFAANRDEWLARPAVGMTVLRDAGPRVIGGRDEQAGGTWLAANEHGVVAALTNRSTVRGRDPSLRSRGELPLALAAHRTAREAVAAFAREVRGERYHPCWLLVGDRESLHYIDMTRPGAPALEELAPGVHVLENNPLRAPSGKARHVTAALAGAESWRGDALVEGLRRVLADHTAPRPEPGEAYDDGFVRLAETRAPCVHAGPYGTRWTAVVRVGEGAPDVRWSEGTPCVATLRSAAGFWSGA